MSPSDPVWIAVWLSTTDEHSYGSRGPVPTCVWIGVVLMFVTLLAWAIYTWKDNRR